MGVRHDYVRLAESFIDVEGCRLPARLANKIEVTPDGCWNWTGCTQPDGYSRVWWDNRVSQAHVAVYGVIVGPVPDGLVLDHLCRNRGCVKPDHLEPVTTAENIRRGLRLKYSNEDVADWFERRARGESLRSIANAYGASHTHVGHVLRGKEGAWRFNQPTAPAAS